MRAPALAAVSSCFVAAFVLSGAGSLDPAPTVQEPGSPYHADPAHPFNRVHRALFRRMARGGLELGLDEPFPLVWHGSDFLLSPARCEEAVAALEALAACPPEHWIADPLHRALIQHDLWTFFDWAAGAPAQARGAADDGALRRRRGLARALARALGRVRLTAGEIATLPSNYSEAAASGYWPGNHDPAHPRRPFLPRGLEDETGAWVLVQEDGARGPLAATHAAVFGGRSSFAVYLALPGGREETLAYLGRLRRLEHPTAPCETGSCGRAVPPEGEPHEHLSRGAPDPPAGSTVALVRRMLLFDDRGVLHATPIVQSIQLRAFLERPADGPPLPAYPPFPEAFPYQAVAQLDLHRRELLDGERGGLVAVGPEEHAFHFVGAHGDGVDLLPAGFEPDAGHAHFATCVGCHGTVGIHSVNAYTGLMTGPGTHYMIPLREPPRRLVPGSLDLVSHRARELKHGRYDWGYLRALLDG